MQRALSGAVVGRGAAFGEDYDPILNAPQFRYPLLALSGHSSRRRGGPLRGTKRTSNNEVPKQSRCKAEPFVSFEAGHCVLAWASSLEFVTPAVTPIAWHLSYQVNLVGVMT